jgi:mRNA interferase YafQ
MQKSTTMKRHLDIELLNDIIRKLANDEQLPEKKKSRFSWKLDWAS